VHLDMAAVSRSFAGEALVNRMSFSKSPSQKTEEQRVKERENDTPAQPAGQREERHHGPAWPHAQPWERRRG
jgi:hypothetical protein